MKYRYDEFEAKQPSPAYVRSLHPITAQDLISKKFDPPDHVVAPWLPTKGLAMAFGPRGIGKTYLVTGIAVAAAAGEEFLYWSAPKPRRVVIIDGEMPGYMLQDRIAREIARGRPWRKTAQRVSRPGPMFPARLRGRSPGRSRKMK